jgi:hypothetical protein
MGMILVALAMVASAAVAGALIGEVTGANAVVSTGEKPVMIAMNPTRALDTRPAPFGPIGVPTAAPIGAKGVLNLTLATKYGIPADATAVQLNVTTLNATTETFLTLYPAGAPRPNASTMNPDVGRTQFNGAVIPLGAGGAVSIYNHLGSVNVLIDVTGYFVDHNHDPRYLESAPGINLLAAGYVRNSASFDSFVGPISKVENIAVGHTRITFDENILASTTDRSVIVEVTPRYNSVSKCSWGFAPGGPTRLNSIDVRCWNADASAANRSYTFTVEKITENQALSAGVSDLEEDAAG